ncbi:hypothetical protein ABT104_25955 [Streptomyces mobaraensis]
MRPHHLLLAVEGPRADAEALRSLDWNSAGALLFYSPIRMRSSPWSPGTR